MVTLVDQMLHIEKQIEAPGDLVKANKLVMDVFNEIRGVRHEK